MVAIESYQEDLDPESFPIIRFGPTDANLPNSLIAEIATPQGLVWMSYGDERDIIFLATLAARPGEWISSRAIGKLLTAVAPGISPGNSYRFSQKRLDREAHAGNLIECQAVGSTGLMNQYRGRFRLGMPISPDETPPPKLAIVRSATPPTQLESQPISETIPALATVMATPNGELPAVQLKVVPLTSEVIPPLSEAEIEAQRIDAIRKRLGLRSASISGKVLPTIPSAELPPRKPQRFARHRSSYLGPD